MMTTMTNPISEIVGMLPKLMLVALIVATTAFAVSKVNAAQTAVQSNVMLVGGDLVKPSGVGFVLAVGLQRLR
jgi:hypothetical protein